MYTGCTSDLCETPEIHVNILIHINTIWVRRPMFHVNCLFCGLLTLQDVHNSVLKVCSLAFFEQFYWYASKYEGPGKRETNGKRMEENATGVPEPPEPGDHGEVFVWHVQPNYKQPWCSDSQTS